MCSDRLTEERAGRLRVDNPRFLALIRNFQQLIIQTKATCTPDPPCQPPPPPPPSSFFKRTSHYKWDTNTAALQKKKKEKTASRLSGELQTPPERFDLDTVSPLKSTLEFTSNAISPDSPGQITGRELWERAPQRDCYFSNITSWSEGMFCGFSHDL